MRINSASRLSSFCGFGCLLLLLGTIEFAAVFVQAPPPNAEKITMAKKLGISKEHMEGLREDFMNLKSRVTADHKQIQLHYVSNEQEPSVKNAEQLFVFIHGFPQNSYAWRHQLQHFRKNNIVYAFDLFNFGMSTKSANALDCSVDKHMADLSEVLAQLKAKHPNAQINLVAHDIGAAIASKLMYNKEAASHVSRFVQINAPNPNSIAGMKQKGTLDIKKMLTNPYVGKLMGFMMPGGILPWGENQANANFLKELFFTDKNTKLEHPGDKTFSENIDLKVYQKALESKEDALAAISFWRAPLAQMAEKVKEGINEKIFMTAFGKVLNIKEKETKSGPPAVEVESVKKIQQPTMVVWGMHDNVFGSEFGQGAVDACEHGVLKQLSGASHWVPEDAPKELNQLLEDFVKGHLDNELSGGNDVGGALGNNMHSQMFPKQHAGIGKALVGKGMAANNRFGASDPVVVDTHASGAKMHLNAPKHNTHGGAGSFGIQSKMGGGSSIRGPMARGAISSNGILSHAFA